MNQQNTLSLDNNGLSLQTGMRLTHLVESTGYPIRQVNGQRIYGPHPHYSDVTPPKGSEVFVGKLPRDMFEDELVPLFSSVGTIYELRLMMDFSGTNRGYGFVCYLDVLSAERAIKSLNGTIVRKDRQIGVCKSVDNCRLFVGGIPRDLTQVDIYLTFSRVTNGVKDVIVYGDYEDRSKNRGFAFIEYESHKAAAMARRELVPGKLNLWDTELKVDWAEPEPIVDSLVMQRYIKGAIATDINKALKNFLETYNGPMSPISERLDNRDDFCQISKIWVTILYVRNLPTTISEATLAVIFSLDGRLHVTKVKKMRDFAFIHYRTRFEAQTALSYTDKLFIDGCVIEVTWSKPPEWSVRRQPRCNVEGYKSYPRHPLCFNKMEPNDNGTRTLPPNVLNKADVKRPVGPIGSCSAFDNANQYMSMPYPTIFDAICKEKGYREPIYEFGFDSDKPACFLCKITLADILMDGYPISLTVEDASSDYAQQKAAYSLMRHLGLLNLVDGTPLPIHEINFNLPRPLGLNHCVEDLTKRFKGVEIGQGDNASGPSKFSCGISKFPYNGPIPDHNPIPAPVSKIAPIAKPSISFLNSSNSSMQRNLLKMQSKPSGFSNLSDNTNMKIPSAFAYDISPPIFKYCGSSPSFDIFGTSKNISGISSNMPPSSNSSSNFFQSSSLFTSPAPSKQEDGTEEKKKNCNNEDI